jgi:hypothetical protein
MGKKIGLTVIAILMWLFILGILPPTVVISWIPLGFALRGIWIEK